MSLIEKSSIRKINSSIFDFKTIPEEFLNFNEWFDEGKKITTLTEYLVRSKSEMNIANILYLNDLVFRYEEPLFADDSTMYLPDFTIEYRGQTWYWEHLGLLENSKYAKHWEKKKAWYDLNFPGQLIITHEGDQQTEEIKEVFKQYFDISL
jgi:hypothetical protein